MLDVLRKKTGGSYLQFFCGLFVRVIELGNISFFLGNISFCKSATFRFSDYMWHEDKFMYNREKNFAYSSNLDDGKPARCVNGVDKYLK